MAEPYRPIVPGTPELSGLSLKFFLALAESWLGTYLFNLMLKSRVPRFVTVRTADAYDSRLLARMQATPLTSIAICRV